MRWHADELLWCAPRGAVTRCDQAYDVVTVDHLAVVHPELVRRRIEHERGIGEIREGLRRPHHGICGFRRELPVNAGSTEEDGWILLVRVAVRIRRDRHCETRRATIPTMWEKDHIRVYDLAGAIV